MIEIVSATRESESRFWSDCALGISLRRLDDQRLVAAVAFQNSRGLPAVFNERIAAPEGADAIVFVHDDVWIDDYFLVERVEAGLQAFDLIGVAGNRRLVRGAPGWPFVDAAFKWDEEANLSGAVAHGPQPFGTIRRFGAVPAQCQVLDGLFIAARRSVLRARDVRFDPRFDFNFYDLDFCRTATARGLRLGTWPICLTHQSSGAANAQRWTANYQRYLEKWEGHS